MSRPGHEIDIERLLQGAGAAWRAEQAEPPVPEAARWRDRRPMPVMSRVVAGAAGLSIAAVVIGAFLVVLIALPPAPRGPLAADDPSRSPAVTQSPRSTPGSSPDRPSSDVPSPDPSPSAAPPPSPSPGVELSSLVVRDGDGVVAAGYIVRRSDLGIRLCVPGPVIAMRTDEPLCGPPSVAVAGVAPEELPGWRAKGSGGATAYLSVEGTWEGGVLHITHATRSPAGPPDLFPHRPAPCDPPVGGWPGRPPSTLEGEDTGRRLQQAIDADPHRYSGLWLTYIDPDGSAGDGNGVITVGVVGDEDVAAAEAEALAELYPYNLCVIPASRSAAELAAVEERLGPVEPQWQPQAEPAHEAVVLKLPVLDAAALERIGADAPLVVVQATVTKA